MRWLKMQIEKSFVVLHINIRSLCDNVCRYQEALSFGSRSKSIRWNTNRVKFIAARSVARIITKTVGVDSIFHEFATICLA